MLNSLRVGKVFYRDYNNFDADSYISDVRQVDLVNKINAENNPNTKFNVFQNTLLNIINKHAPLKRVSKKMHKMRNKPWITTGILKSISVKNRYYSKFLKTKDPSCYQKYKGYRDLLNHLIRKSKKIYYISYFNKFRKKSKMVWSGINDIIQKQKKHSNVLCLSINGKLTTNHKIIANCFNEYFTTVAQRIVDKMKPPTKKFKDNLKTPNPRSLFYSTSYTSRN